MPRRIPEPPPDLGEIHTDKIDHAYAAMRNAAWFARTSRTGSEAETKAMTEITEHVHTLWHLGCDLDHILADLIRHIKG